MWRREDKSHMKTAYFRLPSVAQKRRVLTLPNDTKINGVDNSHTLHFFIRSGKDMIKGCLIKVAPYSFNSMYT